MTEDGLIDRTRLDYKVSLLLCKLAMLTASIFLVIDTFITHDLVSVGIELLAIIGAVYGYQYLKQNGVKRWFTKLLVLFFMIVANASWVTGGGYNVANMMILFLVVFGGILIFKPTDFPVFIFLAVLNLLGLYLLHVEYPQVIALFPSATGKYARFALMLGPFVTGIVMAVFMRQFYHEENKKIKEQNQLNNEQQEEMQRSREQYRILAENSTDIITLHDPGHRVVYITPSARSILGHMPDYFYRTDYFDLIHPDDREELYEAMHEAIDARRERDDYIYRFRHANGYYIWLESRVSRSFDEQGNFLQSVVGSTDITRQKNAMEALRESEQRYRLLAENSGDIVTLYNTAMQCEYASPSVQDILGMTVSEFLTVKAFSRIHPDDREGLRQFVSDAFGKSERRYVYRYRYRHKEGHYVWLESLIRPRYNEQYQLEHLVSVARDVTKIVAQQEKIRESEERFRKLSEDLKEAQGIARIGNWSLELQNGTFTWSATTYSIYGVAETEQPFDIGEELVHPDDQENYVANRTKIMESGSCDCVIRIYRRDGVLRYLNFKARYHEAEDAPGKIVGTVQDVTEQKLAELDIKEKESFIRSIVDNVPNMIYMRDGDGVYYMANRATTKLYECEPEELIGANIKDLHGFTEEVSFILERDQEVLTENKTVEYELSYHDGEGLEHTLAVIKLPFEVGNGNKYILGIATDITRQKAYEAELIRASKEVEEASRSKENFFSVMSHEIRTPLNSILGLSNLLYENDPRKDQKEVMEVMRDSARHLARLINDILDFNKNRAQKILIDEVIFETSSFLDQNVLPFSLQCKKKGLEFKLQVAPEVPRWIRSDPARIKQIMDNILSNAIRFTEQGHVALYVDVTAADQGNARPLLQLHFEDTGIGIPDGSLETIFDPFEQLGSNRSKRYGGTGLGLPIVRDTVQHLGGEIRVESEGGKGSHFYVDLPVTIAEEPMLPEKPKGSEPADLSDLRLLYVEDVFSNQFVLRSYCKQWNMPCEIVSSGFEAVEMAKATRFNVILMDIHMPGMDGYQTTEQIRLIPGYERTPIIAFTADISDQVKHKIKESSMTHYLLKPVNPVQLFELLDTLSRDLQEEYRPDFDLGFYRELVSEDFKSWEEIRDILLEEMQVFQRDVARCLMQQNFEKFREAIHRIKPVVINIHYHAMLQLFDDYRDPEVFQEDRQDFLPTVASLIEQLSASLASDTISAG